MTGYNCFGCCSVNLTNIKEVECGIDKNTKEYSEFKNNNKGFRDRYGKDELDKSGICLNLIRKNDINENGVCAIYPKDNTDDLRFGYCSTTFECVTFIKIQNWNEKKVSLFNFFIKELFEQNKLNKLSFSNEMYNNTIIDKFELWLKINNERDGI
ncbi:hypothetical protein HOK68_01820 [Candidatus Woesearchaeota archaeon]|nr:hypothetical protein [Candidatus Woesearchaeota archaeon]MBT4387549.1 hypothetical protein [Candidatus Woesearchaeota archaeon]MBT4595391.1 hypothetical protein [Candidatus Woesearchaeota archaeon]MBT5741204.1 hypothetical protein [Candidatus Woesearchaeota archaeon]MBT6505498.1 hypothetical protein [Candidatus Woesearchaeota archaeon]